MITPSKVRSYDNNISYGYGDPDEAINPHSTSICFLDVLYRKVPTRVCINLGPTQTYTKMPFWHIARHISALSSEGFILSCRRITEGVYEFMGNPESAIFYSTLCAIRDSHRIPQVVLKALALHRRIKRLGVSYSQCYVYYIKEDPKIGWGHSNFSKQEFHGFCPLWGFVGACYVHTGAVPKHEYWSETIMNWGSRIVRDEKIRYTTNAFGCRKAHIDRPLSIWALCPLLAPILDMKNSYSNKLNEVEKIIKDVRVFDYSEIEAAVSDVEKIMR